MNIINNKKGLLIITFLVSLINVQCQNINTEFEYIRFNLKHDFDISGSSYSYVSFGLHISNKNDDTLVFYIAEDLRTDTSYAKWILKSNSLKKNTLLDYKYVDRKTNLISIPPKQEISIEIGEFRIHSYFSLSELKHMWQKSIDSMDIYYVPNYNQLKKLISNMEGRYIIAERTKFKKSKSFHFKYFLDNKEIKSGDSLSMNKKLKVPDLPN